MRKQTLSPKRMAMDAVMAAVYILIATLFVINTGSFKITLESLPVIIIGFLFGPLDAMLVGFIGELINQILSMGFTPTTLLWVAPKVLQGLVIGLAMKPLRNAYFVSPDQEGHPWLQKALQTVYFFAINYAAAVLVTLTNTFAWYVDSKLYNYYNPLVLFGQLGARIVTGLICTTIMAVIAVPVIAALRRARLVK